MTPIRKIPPKTAKAINGRRFVVGTAAPLPLLATADEDPLGKMAIRIQIGTHSPQVSRVSTRCNPWLAPPPCDTEVCTTGGVGVKC